MKSSENDSTETKRLLLEFSAESQVEYPSAGESLVNAWAAATSTPIKPVLSNVRIRWMYFHMF